MTEKSSSYGVNINFFVQMTKKLKINNLISSQVAKASDVHLLNNEKS